jgi:hypothetical protein
VDSACATQRLHAIEKGFVQFHDGFLGVRKSTFETKASGVPERANAEL